MQAIQWRVRLFLARCRLLHKQSTLKNASTAMQAMGRGWMERRNVAQRRLVMHAAARVIQSAYWEFRKYQQRQAELKVAVDVVERAYLAYKGSLFRIVLRHMWRCRVAATHLQRLWRGYVAKCEVYTMRKVNRAIFLRKAAMVAQNLRRRVFVRHGAAMVIQRKYRIDKFYRVLRHNIVRIKDILVSKMQRVWWGYLGRKYAREYRATLTKFAIMAQRIFRCVARRWGSGLCAPRGSSIFNLLIDHAAVNGGVTAPSTCSLNAGSVLRRRSCRRCGGAAKHAKLCPS